MLRRTLAASLAVPLALALGACGVPGGSGPEPARLSASPSTLELSTAIGGDPDVGQVTITNTGDVPTLAPLTVTPLGAFAPTSDTCTGAVLDPGQTCTLEFTYAPAGGLQSIESSVFVSAPGTLAHLRVQGTTHEPI